MNRTNSGLNKNLPWFVYVKRSLGLTVFVILLVLCYQLVSAINFFKFFEVKAAASYNWYPGYYILASSGATADGKKQIMDDPLSAPFDGFQFRYQWADSELSPGDYSAGFAMLDADLAQVALRNKKLFVMLMYKKFDGTSAVPQDLRTGPGPWCIGSYCGDLVVGSSHLAMLWNSSVETRLRNWLTAMASHLAASPNNKYVAGIVFPETSLGTTDTNILANAGFDPYVYINAIQSNLLASTGAAQNLVTFYYHEGGFVSMDGKSVNAGQVMGDWMLQHPRIGTGTPDAQPKNPKTSGHPCANTKYQRLIPCMPNVQAPDYALTVTDSITSTFNYSLNPAPSGLFGSYITFSYSVGSGPNAFTLADVSNYIKSHPIPAQNAIAPWGNSTSTPTAKPGDASGDGKVDGIDYVIWLNHYGTATAIGNRDGDFNSDQNVDGLDYVIWLNNYGK